MSALGQKRTCAVQNVMSALPSKATSIAARDDDVPHAPSHPKNTRVTLRWGRTARSAERGGTFIFGWLIALTTVRIVMKPLTFNQ